MVVTLETIDAYVVENVNPWELFLLDMESKYVFFMAIEL
jgi:hypothetical protein